MFRNPPGSTDQRLAVETGRFFVLISNRFVKLYEDRFGDLWVTMEAGGLVRRHQGRFMTPARSGGKPSTAAFWTSTRTGTCSSLPGFRDTFDGGSAASSPSTIIALPPANCLDIGAGPTILQFDKCKPSEVFSRSPPSTRFQNCRIAGPAPRIRCGPSHEASAGRAQLKKDPVHPYSI